MRISDCSSDVCSQDHAERLGTPAHLVQRGSDIDPTWLGGIAALGITAGASAPEALVREVIDAVAAHRAIVEEVAVITEENMVFKQDRQRGVSGKSVLVRVDSGGCRYI